MVSKHDFKMSLEPLPSGYSRSNTKTSMKMIPTSKHVVVFGGQYGSEGKASAAEYWAKQLKRQGPKLFVLGENSPNSGHTSSRGATKNIPASSFWADAVILGPDAVVDKDVLLHDWETVGKPPLYIHEHAALLHPETKPEEADFVARISSTGSGSGVARKRKFIDRQTDAVVKTTSFPAGIQLVDDMQFRSLTHLMYHNAAIFELSQGAMLDTNFGRFPYVTSRTTLPQAAVERNGLWCREAQYAIAAAVHCCHWAGFRHGITSHR